MRDTEGRRQAGPAVAGPEGESPEPGAARPWRPGVVHPEAVGQGGRKGHAKTRLRLLLEAVCRRKRTRQDQTPSALG
ncbi:MAG: hypothetical protein ACLFP4_16940, partial [Spirochaetales bacterium]